MIKLFLTSSKNENSICVEFEGTTEPIELVMMTGLEQNVHKIIAGDTIKFWFHDKNGITKFQVEDKS